jgi:hypothetical protein
VAIAQNSGRERSHIHVTIDCDRQHATNRGSNAGDHIASNASSQADLIRLTTAATAQFAATVPQTMTLRARRYRALLRRWVFHPSMRGCPPMAANSCCATSTATRSSVLCCVLFFAAATDRMLPRPPRPWRLTIIANTPDDAEVKDRVTGVGRWTSTSGARDFLSAGCLFALACRAAVSGE